MKNTLQQARVLALPAAALSDPKRLDLALIEAEMLWPDDPQARRECRDAAAISTAIENQDCLPVAFLRPLLSLAAKTPRLSELAKDAEKRFLRGFKAGYVLHEALGRASLDDYESSMGAIVEGLVLDLRRDKRGRFGRFSKKTFDNYDWPIFRSVAHYWAASLVHVLRDKEPFPCFTRSLREFLALVEAFRLAGEMTQMWRSPGPLLRAEETLRLPPELGIQAAILEFDPTTVEN